jgi:hypothetical protein
MHLGTDPRDKIYGLLGLATDNLDIIPDYNKTPQEVYIDVARAQINSTQNLDIVTQSLWPRGHTSSTAPRAEWIYSRHPSLLVENLPSWLPNFSCTIAKKILFAQRSIFSAGAEKCKCPVEIDPDGGLTVTGIVLGAITTMKPIRENTYFRGQWFSPWARDWMPDGLADPNSEDKSYVTGGNAFEAYWRTLMTDCLAHPTRRLSQDDLKEYTEIFNEWRQKISLLPLNGPELGQHDIYDGNQALLSKMDEVARRTGIYSLIKEWQFAELAGGVYAMVPWEGLHGDNKSSKIGDLVVAVDGGKVPLVLRERNNVGQHENGRVKWEVIGTAYAHGFMDGLASQWAADGKSKSDFHLI